MSKDNKNGKENVLAILDLEYELPAINKICRQPSQLKINYELLARLCAMGCSMSDCAFAMATTTNVLDLKIRKEKKMTFHEFSGCCESFQNIGLRRVLLKKALVDEHFPSIQWLSINQLGMSKDGMMCKDDSQDSSNYSTEELIQMLKEQAQDGSTREKKNNEQRKDITSTGPLQRESGNTGSRMHSGSGGGSGSAGCSDSKGGGECHTNQKEVSQKKTREKIQATKKKVLETIKQ